MKKIKNKYFKDIVTGVIVFLISFITGESFIISIITAIISALAIIGICKLLEKRKSESYKKSYEMDLPDLMIHVAMFVEAGLGIKEALERAVLAGNQNKPLYRDLRNVFEMERKIGSKDFSIILQEMAEKQKIPPLSNFSAVIIQNLRKGSDELSDIFTAQAQIYRNERRRIAGKLADEAATLLLIPSTIVLVALVLLLITPAVMAFMQGI